MAPLRVRVLVSGRVQGVCYRVNAERQASSLGLRGWVRNLADGRVEALLEGPPGAVERMLAWCQQGPPAAAVSGVAVEPDTGGQPLAGFEIRRDASGD